MILKKHIKQKKCLKLVNMFTNLVANKMIVEKGKS